MNSGETRKELLILVGIICVALVVATLQTLSVKRVESRFAATPVVNHVPTTAATPFPTPSKLPDGNDWTQYRFDLKGTGVNPEDLLTKANASQLTQRWTANAKTTFESTPAIVNGVVYIPNGRLLYAYELLSGKELWHYDGAAKGRGAISSSVVVDPTTHMAYFGTPDAYVYAVDIRTGTGVWNEQIGDPSNGAYIWGSPIVANGKVYIGLASAEDRPCVRGAVFAFDAVTGQEAWVHYTEAAYKIGGGVWTTPAVDTNRGEIIMGTGNPCTTPANDQEQDSIIGLDWNTGKTNWKYTSMPSDTCDCDFTGVAMNFTYNGKDYIVEGNKFGGAYALVRQGNGVKLAWMVRLAQIEAPHFGGIYQPPSYRNGIVYFAAGTQLDGSCPAVYALRADTGSLVWKMCTNLRLMGGDAITGDLVFIGQKNMVQALELTTGRIVWQAQISGSLVGGIAISRGLVVVPSSKGVLYCYGIPAS
jgi:outer membrane protein assembly factor BamB